MKWLILILWEFVFLAGCSTHVKNLNTPEGTLSEANRLMKDEFYEEARNQFFRIKTEFPESSLQAEADIRIADSYFEEDSYSAAADSYENFIKTYPRHPKTSYALFKMGQSYMKRMPDNPQRDSREAQKAVDTFTRLIVDYPQSEYVPEALKSIDKAQNNLAEKIYRIARFYEKKEEFSAAASRYAELIELYPDHRLVRDSMQRQIRMLKESGEIEKASQLEKRFNELYSSTNESSE